jgi:hypothetical protein
MSHRQRKDDPGAKEQRSLRESTEMWDKDRLLPPLRIIHERLTRNRREHRLLRTLHRLAVEGLDDRSAEGGPESLPDTSAVAKEVRRAR